MQQFAWMFAQQRTVVYVDNPGVRPLRWAHLPRIAARLGRVFAPRGAAAPAHLARAMPTLSHVAPLLLPSPVDLCSMAVNRVLFCQQVRSAMARAGITHAILWTSSPTDPVVGLMQAFPWETVVYDCVDDLPGLHPYRARQLQAAEDALLRRADLVLVTAQALAEKLRGRAECVLVPNGVDLPRFARLSPPPATLAALPRPIIGFLGSMLPGVFDVDLLVALADTHPEWSVIVVGPVPGAFAEQLRNSRVYTLGPVAYDEVPAILRAFDVGLIPFVESTVTRAIHPLKVYEYLACGLPVVSTPLPELDHLAPYVVQTRGLPSFTQAIAAALIASPNLAAERQAVARQYSWEERFAQVMQHLTVK
ncbi:MAG: glycosyltransferase [Armatimonadota bacterium]